MENQLPKFTEFQKIPRWSRNIVVSEKIDGCNAVIYIDASGQIVAGSRTRWITLERDNHGFARWVKEHEAELRELGVGYHHGEWWGQGINRGYGLKEKRWSLLNTSKWRELDRPCLLDAAVAPACCHVVPVLYEGPMSENPILLCLEQLRTRGSLAAPGFMRPEGVVIYHVQGNLFFKKTLEHDEAPKSLVKGGESNDL